MPLHGVQVKFKDDIYLLRFIWFFFSFWFRKYLKIKNWLKSSSRCHGPNHYQSQIKVLREGQLQELPVRYLQVLMITGKQLNPKSTGPWHRVVASPIQRWWNAAVYVRQPVSWPFHVFVFIKIIYACQVGRQSFLDWKFDIYQRYHRLLPTATSSGTEIDPHVST